MKNSDIVPPPHIKNKLLDVLFIFNPPLLEFYAATYSSQPITLCKPCPRIHVRNGMRFPLVAPLGNHIPLRPQIPGRIFRQGPQPETTSHSKGKFRDTASATPCQEKSLEDFEAFTFVLFCTKDRERRSYSPSTAFLAATAIWSRSSLVGWSFAATQLSSSILNRALSGSCSSMAS